MVRVDVPVGCVSRSTRRGGLSSSVVTTQHFSHQCIFYRINHSSIIDRNIVIFMDAWLTGIFSSSTTESHIL